MRVSETTYLRGVMAFALAVVVGIAGALWIGFHLHRQDRELAEINHRLILQERPPPSKQRSEIHAAIVGMTPAELRLLLREIVAQVPGRERRRVLRALGRRGGAGVPAPRGTPAPRRRDSPAPASPRRPSGSHSTHTGAGGSSSGGGSSAPAPPSSSPAPSSPLPIPCVVPLPVVCPGRG